MRAAVAFVVALLACLAVAAVDGRRTRLPRPSSSSPSYSTRRSPLTGQLIAVPNADLLRFQADEIAVLIHYNIATYLPVAHDGCNGDVSLTPPASVFNPYLLNTDNWSTQRDSSHPLHPAYSLTQLVVNLSLASELLRVQSMRALGASAATLVVKHNWSTGFTTWPTKVTFPTTSGEVVPYNYSIAYSPVASTDLVRDFVQSTRAAGIAPGFYYSVVSNNYLNVANGQVGNSTSPGQVSVNQSTYNSIVLAQLNELWSNYGQLEEIWFDGGYNSDQLAALQRLLQSHQPHAAIFNGCQSNGTCVQETSVRWIGTEDGQAPDPTWSTGVSNDGGDPDSPIFCPAECDTTLQDNDRWFWGANQTLRGLAELVDVYHQTVGRNCRLEMDLTPDTTGLIPARYAARYAQLGDFIRACYSNPIPPARQSHPNATTWLLSFATPTAIDRVQLMEDQTRGQVIRAYQVDAMTDGGGWTRVASGTSVGHKKIDLFTSAVTVTAVRLSVTKAVDVAYVASVQLHLCDQLTREAVKRSEMAEAWGE